MDNVKMLKAMLSSISDEHMSKIIDEAYSFHETGLTAPDLYIFKLARVYEVPLRTLEDCILDEISKRYNKVVLLMLKTRISDFLK